MRWLLVIRHDCYRISFRRIVILVLAPLLVLCFSTCCFPRHPIQAARLLESVAHPERPQKGKAPRRIPVSYETQGHAHRGDLYVSSQSRGGILLVAGATEQGKNDPRVVTFAAALARANFAVLVPDLVDVRELKVGARDIREIADGFSYLASRSDLAPQGCAGMAAPSYALGPTVLAALEPDIRNQVHFILGIGGYYDLKQVISFFTTGYFREDGTRWRHLAPNEYGKWVFALSNADRLSDPSDRETMRVIAKRKMENSDAAVEPLVGQLHGEGHNLFELLTNKDPQRVPELIEKLPQAVRADITALDLSQHDLSALRARLILVHGFVDGLIPYPQSKALARALPPGQARLSLIPGLAHVDIHGLAPADTLKLVCAIDALLAEQASSQRR
jgi:pimeloyl-ACP methyl ester carboxylesterase